MLSRIRSVLVTVITLLLLSVTAVVMLLLSLLTLFRARRICAEVIAPPVAKAALWLAGIKLVVVQPQPFCDSQTIYVANHTSSLDLFILIAMRLPNTRFFMKRKFLLLLPLGIIAWLTGTFFTPPQTDRSKRVACFQNAEDTIRRSGESVFLSPEGTRVTSGEIGPFNKGTLHLATNLKVPIVPIFIDIPRAINPGKGIATKAGQVTVEVKPAISTHDWMLDDLEQNKKHVRDLFVGYLAASRRQQTAEADSLEKAA